MEQKSRTLTDQELDLAISQNREQIHTALKANFGLKPGVVHNYSLKKAIRAVIEEHHTSLKKAIDSICKIPIEDTVAQTIIPHITIYETYFFRHPEHFAWMREIFLPALEQKRHAEQNHVVRCWSAGCSTGEEAYSIAITLYEYFKNKQGWALKVLATDINPESLDIAQQGYYGPWSFREMDRETIEKYFHVPNDRRISIPGLPQTKLYHIDSHIQQMVTFAQLNLLTPQWNIPELSDSTFDLIFCRNVFIYFDQDTAQTLALRFAKHLKPDGAFIAGPSEPWFLNGLPFIPKQITNGTIFIKKEHRDFSEQTKNQLPPHIAVSRPTPPMQSFEHRHSKKTLPNPAPKPATSSSLESKEIIRARLLADSGEASHAIEIISDLIQKEKTNPELYYLRGLAYFHAKDFASAESDLKKSLFLEPDNVVAYITLAAISEKKNNIKEMQKYYSNALHFLSKIEENAIVPGSNGIPAKAMREMIQSLMDTYGNR